EGDRVAALGDAGHAAAHDLAMLDALRHQHGSGPRPGDDRGARGELGSADGLLGDVPAVDPDLDADAAICRVGVDLAVAELRAERPQRDAPFLVPLASTHLRAAEAAGDGDLDALRAGLHRALDGLLHRLLEGDAAAQLPGDVHRDEIGVELRLADLLDLQLDLAVREHADLLAQDLDVRAALADDDARLGRVDGDRHVVDATLDLHAADAGVREPLLDELADRDVFLEGSRVFLIRVPLRGPGARDTQAEAVRMDLVSHFRPPGPRRRS